MARCHRIGQTRPVVVYKLCTKGTIDESIMGRAEAKRKLEKMVISEDIPQNLNNVETLIKLKKLLESTENLIVKSKHDGELLICHFWYFQIYLSFECVSKYYFLHSSENKTSILSSSNISIQFLYLTSTNILQR